MARTTFLPAYILAGGQSRRFGSDKARVMIRSQPLLVHLLERLQDCGHPCQVVADRAARYQDLGVECLVDARSDAGPMAGLVTAIEHCQQQLECSWLLLLSCDLLSWQKTWTEALTAAVAQGRNRVLAETPAAATPQVVSFRSDRLQPLPALYHVSLLPVAQRRLASGPRGLVDLAESCDRVELSTPDAPIAYSFNTRQELSQAFERALGSDWPGTSPSSHSDT